MTGIDFDNLRSAVLERLVEEIEELSDSDFFLDGVHSAADYDSTRETTAYIRGIIRDAAETIASL